MTEERRKALAAWWSSVGKKVDKDREMLRAIGERNSRGSCDAQLDEIWNAVLLNLVPEAVELGEFKQWDWRRERKTDVPMRLNPRGFVHAPRYSQANVVSLGRLLKAFGYDEVQRMLAVAETHVQGKPYRKKQKGLQRLANLRAALASHEVYVREMEKERENFKQVIPLGRHMVPVGGDDTLLECEMELQMESRLTIHASNQEKGLNSSAGMPASDDVKALWYFSVAEERWDELLMCVKEMQDEMVAEAERVVANWRKRFAGEMLAARIKKSLRRV